jgi:hypothetical protein
MPPECRTTTNKGTVVPTAPDVTKKGGRKPPAIRDVPWSPGRVVRQKKAPPEVPPPDNLIDLTFSNDSPPFSNKASTELSPPLFPCKTTASSSPFNIVAAASTLRSFGTAQTSSVAAAASLILYQQLYPADNNDDDGDDYNNILDMDIDSKEEFRSSFPKDQNSSKLRVKGGPVKPDVSKLPDKEAAELLDKWKKERKVFTDKVNRIAVRADQERRTFEFEISRVTVSDLRSSRSKHGNEPSSFLHGA